MIRFPRAIRDLLKAAIRLVWLRPHAVRPVLLGPARGLRLAISPPLMNRLSVFFRAYEANVTQHLQRVVQPGMTVIVVGAHVGIHTLYIAKLVGKTGKVYAFEGWPENFKALERNITLNPHIAEVIALPYCVTTQPGRVRMASGASDGKHHIADEQAAQSIEVEAVSLDSFWQPAECPHLIVIDIEGHELAALEGAVQLIQRCKPHLILEHHGQAAALEAWLCAYAYERIWSDPRHTFALF